MMQKTTKGPGLLGGILAAAGTLVVMVLYAGSLLVEYFCHTGESLFITGLVLVGVLLCAGVAVGVVVALIQRIREVKHGEEEQAKKY
jgi:hypothetical protein